MPLQPCTRTTLLLALWAVAGSTAGCVDSHPRDAGEPGASGGATTSTPAGGVSPDADAVVRVGERDAALTLDDGLELSVPADAVGAPTEIGVRVDDVRPTAFELASRVYRFEPAGLRFTRPVTVRIPLDGAPPADARVYWTNPAGGYEALDGRVEGDFMVAEVEHFSVGFVGTVSDAAGSGACAGAGRCSRVSDAVIDAVDLLFVVDNSGSMREEQEALAQQFPRMIEVLASGDVDLDGTIDFPPVRDLHLGVVSSDMGLVDIEGIPGCAGLGDDGLLQSTPNRFDERCAGTYPQFLSHAGGQDDPAQTASDFACIAALGTEGCGFEQQLESALKALWPAQDADPWTGDPIDPNRVTFLAPEGLPGELGHGDGDNAGFLRRPADGVTSLLAVIVVTDEEDCSSADTRHFTPDIYLGPSDPLAMQDYNLRCFLNPQNLHPLERYVDGFKALRGGRDELVVFGAIAGVPTDLVDLGARFGVDLDDPVARDAYYDGILGDPRMQEVPDPTRTPEQGGNLTPSCVTATGRAFPPRRLVEVARRFGDNGVVQSICQEDFTPAMDRIVDRIAARITGACYPTAIERADDGSVACDVVWRLPVDGGDGVPSTCADLPFLASRGDADGRHCTVAQLPVTDGSEPDGSGWYYDDFSDRLESCPEGQRQGVAFTEAARPPAGVGVFLDCL